MNSKKRKMAFYELDQGRLALAVQKAFEEMQMTAHESGQQTEITLKIKLIPSKDRQERFGKFAYTVNTKEPPKQSIELTTELKNGFIIADGRSAVDVLQNELEFSELLTINKNKEGTNGQ